MSKKHKNRLQIIILLTIAILAIPAGGWYLSRLSNPTPFVAPLSFDKISKTSPTPTPIPPNTWFKYNNSKLGITFEYPASYKVNDDGNPLEIMSPLNAVKTKDLTLEEGELKVEIYLSPAKKYDTLQNFIYEERSNVPVIVNETSTTINGQRAYQFSWQGNGDGVTYLTIYKGQRIIIVRYPLNTSPDREAEFDRIFSSLKFTK